MPVVNSIRQILQRIYKEKDFSVYLCPARNIRIITAAIGKKHRHPQMTAFFFCRCLMFSNVMPIVMIKYSAVSVLIIFSAIALSPRIMKKEREAIILPF